MTTRAQRAAKTICHTLGTTGRHHAPVAEIIQREFQQQADALASAKDALEKCVELSASILDGSDMDKLDDWAEQARAALALAQLETK